MTTPRATYSTLIGCLRLNELAAFHRALHLHSMDFRSRPQTGQEPPSGEYVIISGRPYPEKLERRFRLAAAIVGGAAAIAFAVLLIVKAPSSPNRNEAAEFGMGIIMSGGLAYTVVRLIGMFAVAATGLRRGPEQYTVEWQETPRGDGWSREKTVAAILLVVFVILAAIASHR